MKHVTTHFNDHTFRALIEQSAEGIAILSAEGIPLYISPSIKKILGYTVEEVIALGLFKLTHPDDVSEMEIVLKKVLENPGIPLRGHTGRMLHKDGSWRWLEATVTNMLDDPAIAGIVDNFRDITDKKIEEEKLIHADQNLGYTQIHLKEAQAMAHLGSWEINFATGISVWSDELCRIYGLSPEDNLQSYASWISFMHPDDLDHVKKITAQGEASIKNMSFFHRIVRKDGTIRHLHSHAHFQFDGNDKPVGLYGVAHDVTDTKETEQALRESELFNKGILASLDSHIAVIEKNGNILAVNTAWNDFAKENGNLCLARLSKGENYFDVCIRAADAGDAIAEQAMEGIHSVFKKRKETFELEYPCDSPGERRWFVLRVMKFGKDGSKIVLTHQTITSRKNAEESLHRSQSNLKAIIENTDATIYSLDSELRYITFNQQLKNSLRQVYDLFISPGDNVYDFLEKLEPGEAKEWEHVYRKALLGQTVKFEKEFHVNNYHSYFDFSIYPIWENKNVIGLSCFAFDVTEQKRAKEALKESELRYRQIVETAQEGIWLVDENQVTVFVNNKLCEILGYEKQEMTGKHIYAFMDAEGKQIKAKLAEKKHTAEISHSDFKYISKTGKEVWASISANPIFDENGRYTGSLRMITDITSKKKMGVLLENANSLARLGNWEADLVGNTLYWSPVAKQIYEVPETFIPDPATANDYYKPGFSRQAINHAIEEALLKITGWDLELQIITAKGNTCWVRSIGEAECMDGKCIRLSGSIQDIDAMKKSAEELKDKNKELKELSAYLQNVRETERKHIAREVHDELGQMASSLQIDVDWLGIKTDGMGETVNERIVHANKIIKELIITIRKIASGLRPSILDDFGLNAALQWYCNEFQQLNNIECEFIEEFDDEGLSMELKTELFRMSQESLTNVMRHSQAKKVTVHITEDINKIYMVVADNGIGFDTGKRKNTLGLLGLKERAVSINGELNIISSPGKGTTISAIITKK